MSRADGCRSKYHFLGSNRGVGATITNPCYKRSWDIPWDRVAALFDVSEPDGFPAFLDEHPTKDQVRRMRHPEQASRRRVPVRGRK